MNCPKCGSPINPGDKFCQVCGSAVETTTPAVEPQPTPVAQPQVEVTPQPVQQPSPAPAVMPAPMPMPAPVAPVEPKKNNTLVVVLVAVIAILVVAIVAILFLGKGNEEKPKDNPNGGNVVATNDPKYNEVKVGKYKLKLMEGYSAEQNNDDVVIANKENTAAALISYFPSYSISDIDILSVTANFKSAGFEATAKETTVEGKKAIIFTGKYNTYDHEVLYVQVSGGLMGAEAQYTNTGALNSEAEKIHKMVALTTIGEVTTNATTNAKPFLNQALSN